MVGTQDGKSLGPLIFTTWKKATHQAGPLSVDSLFLLLFFKFSAF